MPLQLPTTLSPSKVSTFKDCALAFRFSAIDRLPQPPSLAATRGSLVHRALELLFCDPAPDRTRAAAERCLDQAVVEFATNPEMVGLELSADDMAVFVSDASALLDNYFQLEDPTSIHPIGIELGLAVEVGGVTLRGIIDRLEIDANGELVVTDYKTGRVPSAMQEQSRLGGVHFYALLCERLFGKRPARVQLLYLSKPEAITTVPSEQSSRGLERKLGAIWQAVERACEQDNFRPRPSKLCDYCAFKAYCPSFGGSIDAAVAFTDDREASRQAELGLAASTS